MEDPDHKQRLHEILVEYFNRIEAGQALDQEELLRRYPDYATELTEFFADHSFFKDFAEPSQPISGTSLEPPANQANTPTVLLGETARASPGTIRTVSSQTPPDSRDRHWFIVGRWQEYEGEMRANVLRILAIGAFYLVELINYYGLRFGFLVMPKMVDKPLDCVGPGDPPGPPAGQRICGAGDIEGRSAVMNAANDQDICPSCWRPWRI